MVKKAKPKKAVTETVERESKKLPKINRLIEIVAETLQDKSEGEFKLPSTLVQYTSGPKSSLGLHREHYMPLLGGTPYFLSDTREAWELYMHQAHQIISEIVSGGFPVDHHEYDLPLCDDCK